MLVTSSKDILFIVIAFCVLLLTIFIVWLLYYVIAVIRDARKVIKGMEEIVSKVESAVDFIKKKLDSSAGHIMILGEAVKQIMKFAMEKRAKVKAGKKKVKK